MMISISHVVYGDMGFSWAARHYKNGRSPYENAEFPDVLKDISVKAFEDSISYTLHKMRVDESTLAPESFRGAGDLRPLRFIRSWIFVVLIMRTAANGVAESGL